MAGYARVYTRLCGRSHERLAECVWMHVAQRYGWAGKSMDSQLGVSTIEIKLMIS